MASMPERRRQDRELRKLISDGVFATKDKQGQINILRQWQREGNVPTHFDTPNQLIDQVAAVLASGKPKAEALQELQVFLPRTFFDKSGNINKRVVRNLPGKSLSDAWDLVNSGLSAAQLTKIQKADWEDLQKQYREVGRRLGIKLDIGHFKTSETGSPQDISAASAEPSDANQAAGSTKKNPDRPMFSAEMDNVGASSNKVEGFSEAVLRAMGLPTRGGSVGSPLNPYIGVLLGTEYKGISSRLLPDRNLEQLNRYFEDQVKQGANPVAMYDYIRERAGQRINPKEMANAGLEQYDLSKFHPSQAVKTPVRVTRPPTGSALSQSFREATGLRPPKVSKGNAALAAVGLGAYLAAGESPANAMALTALDNTIGQIESSNTAGGSVVHSNGYQVDPSTNKILGHSNPKVANLSRGLGATVKGGRVVPVPYGSQSPGSGGRAAKARDRGSRISLNIGGIKIPLPELGISEALRINK